MAGLEILGGNYSSTSNLPPDLDIRISKINDGGAHMVSAQEHNSTRSAVDCQSEENFETINHDHMTFDGNQVILHEPNIPEDVMQIAACRMNETNQSVKTYQQTELEFNFEGKKRNGLSMGKNRIPPHPLTNCEKATVIMFSIVQIISGSLAVVMGVVVQGALSLNSVSHAAPLWWTGIMPTVLGSAGCLCGWFGKRKWVLAWGASSFAVLLFQTTIMLFIGNFTLALYEVWPVHISTYNGHPLCTSMVGRCYCQDYFHGAYSHQEMKHVQYIHEDVVWKETGFISCWEVGVVSSLYFTVMGCLTVFTVVTSAAFIASLCLSVCAKTTVKQFYPLEEVGYDEPFEEEQRQRNHSDNGGEENTSIGVDQRDTSMV